MFNHILKLFLLISVFHGLLTSSLQAQSVYQAHTTVDFISNMKTIQPVFPVVIGLRMKMDPEWHVYWRNPGDSGLPPSIEWKLPEGFSAGPIQWPYPKRINVGPLTSFGYEEEVILWSVITPPENLNGDLINISARVKWLACKVDCIPGQTDLSLSFPIDEAIEKNEEYYQLLQESYERFPISQSHWKINASENEDYFFIDLVSADPNDKMKELTFFSYNETLINHAATQQLNKKGSGYELAIKKSSLIRGEVKYLEGILVQDLGWGRDYRDNIFKSLEVKITVGENALVGIKPSVPLTLIFACWSAFLGGIILNFMPCVLPVLSLKMIGLVKTVHDRRKMIAAGVVFTSGVLVSFWILAGLLITLQSAGHKLGWGFQFQSSVFVSVMACILFVLALNLFGVFEIGVLNVSSGILPSSGLSGSFFSGMLATVLATPCTAPFMGTALSFAITQPPMISLLIFTCLGLGMAAPFLMLCIFPQLLSFLPKPGKWMNVLKIIFGFVLLLCVVWLGWVLNLQKNVFAIVVLMIGLSLMATGAIAGGLFQRQGKPLGFILVFLLFVSGSLIFITTGLKFIPDRISKTIESESNGISWQKFSPELLTKIRREGKPVLVDFTAAWCLTCQVNDRLAFNNERVVEYFRQSGIFALKADWTNNDEAITQALAGYGKNSIPVYVFYSPGAQQPIFLPEILTPEIVLKLLKDFNGDTKAFVSP